MPSLSNYVIQVIMKIALYSREYYTDVICKGSELTNLQDVEDIVLQRETSVELPVIPDHVNDNVGMFSMRFASPKRFK